MPSNLHKGSFVDRIATEAKISKSQAEAAYEALIGGIQDALAAGDKVTLTGFGTFSTADRKGRTGRNPKTGAPIYIAARRVPKFSAGKGLKDSVADSRIPLATFGAQIH